MAALHTESGHCVSWMQQVSAVCGLQIDEIIKTGTLAALSEAEGAVEGEDVPEKQKAVKGKATDMAMKFL